MARLVLLGGAVGYLQGTIAGIGKSITSQGPTIRSFAEQQQQANQMARLLGMSIGQLKSIRGQAERQGISEEHANQIASGLLELRAKLSREGGRTQFQEMLRRSGLQSDPGMFSDYTMALSQAKDKEELYKLIQEERKNIEKYLIGREGMDPELAKEFGIKWLVLHGLPAQAVALEELKKPTAEYEAKQQQRADHAELWVKEVVKLERNITSIHGKLLVAMLTPEGPFYTALQGVVKATAWMADNAEKWAAFWFFVQNPNLLIPFFRGGPAPEKPAWPPSLNPLEWHWNPFKWRWRMRLLGEIDELTDQIQKINLIVGPTGPRIVPASFALGTQGVPGSGGDGAPGTPGTDTGGTPGPGASRTPGTGTGGTPGTPSGQPTITPQPPSGSGVLYNPITSQKFMGGVGGRSASRGAGGHQGEDWGAPIGTPVHAVRDGVIIKVGTDNFGQPTATIDHGDGTFTRDLHLQPGSVPEKGTKVYGGQPYARSGTANNVPHLHHERWSGRPGQSGSRIISPMEESGRKPREGMEGGKLAPGSVKPGESRATPGAELPPAAEGGDIYTQQYPIWPGGGGKPYGSDVGPGRGRGAGGGQFGGGGASGDFGGGPIKRPWRQGDPPPTGFFKGKPFPVLSPEATPLPPLPGSKIFSGVSEGRGVATHFSRAPTGGRRGGAWGDPSDPKESAALDRLPDRLQGISLSSPQTLGQFFEVTDPNTGLTHVMQQTDVGPGVRTQTLVDISANKALQLGYDQKSFEAQQNKKLWEVRNAGFGLTMRPTAVGAETQRVTNRVAVDLPSGMDIEADRSVLDRASGIELRADVRGEAKVSVDVTTPPKVGSAPEGLFKADAAIQRQSTMENAKSGPSVEVVNGD